MSIYNIKDMGLMASCGVSEVCISVCVCMSPGVAFRIASAISVGDEVAPVMPPTSVASSSVAVCVSICARGIPGCSVGGQCLSSCDFVSLTSPWTVMPQRARILQLVVTLPGLVLAVCKVHTTFP